MTPGGGDGLARLENHEPAPGAGEEVTDREAALAAADNRDIETPAGIAGRPVHRVCRVFGRVHARPSSEAGKIGRAAQRSAAGQRRRPPEWRYAQTSQPVGPVRSMTKS